MKISTFYTVQQGKKAFINKRICVEQAFGVLKSRFRLLLQSQHASPRVAKQFFFAAVSLHNFLLIQRRSAVLQQWNLRSIDEIDDRRIGSISQATTDNGNGADIMRETRDQIAHELCA